MFRVRFLHPRDSGRPSHVCSLVPAAGSLLQRKSIEETRVAWDVQDAAKVARTGRQSLRLGRTVDRDFPLGLEPLVWPPLARRG